MRVSFNHSEGLTSLSNQFIKARSEGRPLPASSNAYMKGTRTRMDPRQKAAIQATQLANRLHKFAMARGARVNKLAMRAEQVSAAKVVIDKGMPSLSAIEHSDADPLEAMSESEMTELIRSHIRSHPEVLQALNLVSSLAVVPSDADTSSTTGTDGPLQP